MDMVICLCPPFFTILTHIGVLPLVRTIMLVDFYSK